MAKKKLIKGFSNDKLDKPSTTFNVNLVRHNNIKSFLKKLFKPSILKVTLTIFYIAVCFMFLSSVFSIVKIMPCKIQYFPTEGYKFGFCTLNPAGMKLNTIYFVLPIFDFIYQLVYLAMMVLVLPYTLSCVTMYVYRKYIRRDIDM